MFKTSICHRLTFSTYLTVRILLYCQVAFSPSQGIRKHWVTNKSTLRAIPMYFDSSSSFFKLYHLCKYFILSHFYWWSSSSSTLITLLGIEGNGCWRTSLPNHLERLTGDPLLWWRGCSVEFCWFRCRWAPGPWPLVLGDCSTCLIMARCCRGVPDAWICTAEIAARGFNKGSPLAGRG